MTEAAFLFVGEIVEGDGWIFRVWIGYWFLSDRWAVIFWMASSVRGRVMDWFCWVGDI